MSEKQQHYVAIDSPVIANLVQIVATLPVNNANGRVGFRLKTKLKPSQEIV